MGQGELTGRQHDAQGGEALALVEPTKPRMARLGRLTTDIVN